VLFKRIWSSPAKLARMIIHALNGPQHKVIRAVHYLKNTNFDTSRVSVSVTKFNLQSYLEFLNSWRHFKSRAWYNTCRLKFIWTTAQHKLIRVNQSSGIFKSFLQGSFLCTKRMNVTWNKFALLAWSHKVQFSSGKVELDCWNWHAKTANCSRKHWYTLFSNVPVAFRVVT